MKVLRRRLLLAGAAMAAVLAALLVAFVIAINVLDADQFRPLVQRRLHEATGREVTFSQLELSALPLPSLVVHDLVVAAPAAGLEPWIEAKALRARVKLRPLFAGRIEVLGIAIDQPTIRVLRAADGRLNLETLMRQKKADAERERVAFGSLQVRDGRVIIADAYVHPGSIERLELTGLDLRVPSLAARPLLAKASGQVEPSGGSFSFDGHFGPGNDLGGQLDVETLDLAALSPWLESLSGMSNVKGRLTCDLELSRDATGMAARGSVGVEGLALPVALRGSRPLDASLDLDVTTDAAGSVDLRRFRLAIGKTRVDVTGSVADRDGKQVAEIRLARCKVRPADLSGAAAALGFAVPQDILGGDAIDMAGKALIIRGGEPRQVERVVVDGLEVSGARLVVRRDEAGRWILPGASGAASRSGAGSGAAFAARNVKLRDVNVLLDDRLAGGLGRVETSGLSLSLASYAASEPGPFELSARIAGGSVNVKGQVAAGGDTALDVSVERASLAELRPLMSSLVGMMPTEGTLTWRSRITGQFGGRLDLVGKAQLTGAKLTLPDGRQVVLDLPIEHDIRFEPGGRIIGKRLVLGLPSGSLPLTVQVEPDRFAIATDGETTLSPESLRWLLALAGSHVPFGLETDDPTTLDVRLARIDGRLAMAGHVALSRARITHALLPAALDVAHARIVLEGDRIDVEDAALRLGASALAGSLSVSNFDSPRLGFDLVAAEADLDELFALTGAASDAPSAPESSGPSLVERMRAEGRLRVEHATFGGLAMTRFDSMVALADGVLVFDPASLALYDGTARATGRFDLRQDDVGFTVDANLEGVDVGPLMTAGMDYRDLDGRGNATLHLEGTAGTLAKTLATLQGTGDMALSDGSFRGLNALESLKKAGVFGEQSLASLADRLARDGTPFSNLAARFSFDRGTMGIDAFEMATPDAEIGGKGRVNLLAQTIDMDLLIEFSKSLSDQMRAEGSRAAEFFWSASKERVSLPTRLSGPLAGPTADINYSAAAAQAARGRLTDLLTSALGGGRRSDPSHGSSAPPEAPSDAGGASGGAVGEANVAPSDDTSASETPAPGTLAASLDSLKFGGAVLAPDLKIRATLSGVDISHAVLSATDDKGRVLASLNDAFAADVATFYASAPRDQPARIPVKVSIDGKSLLGTRRIVVRIQAVDGSGALSSEAKTQVERGGLF